MQWNRADSGGCQAGTVPGSGVQGAGVSAIRKTACNRLTGVASACSVKANRKSRSNALGRRAVTTPVSSTVATVVLLDCHSASTSSRFVASDITRCARNCPVSPTSKALDEKAIVSCTGVGSVFVGRPSVGAVGEPEHAMIDARSPNDAASCDGRNRNTEARKQREWPPRQARKHDRRHAAGRARGVAAHAHPHRRGGSAGKSSTG